MLDPSLRRHEKPVNAFARWVKGETDMNRRRFLTAAGGLATLPALPTLASDAAVRVKSTSGGPPRKVIVGTAMQAFWGDYPGLQNRLGQLAGMVDEMAEQARTKYGRGLDLAVLPETAITGEAVFSPRTKGAKAYLAALPRVAKKKRSCMNYVLDLTVRERASVLACHLATVAYVIINRDW